MSRRYKGAVISATPPTTTGGDSGTAPGEWTLQQQMQAQGGSVWPSQPPPNYIENVFSTYLYTVDGTTTQAIPNGIDLTTYGGIVWEKARNQAYGNLTTYQSASKYVVTNSTNAAVSTGVTFTSNGYTMNNVYGPWSPTGTTIASWTFRKQAKFFDIQTYTGNGISNTRISHNLGSVPGCIIVKCTSNVAEWVVYHRSITQDGVGIAKYLRLDSTAAVQSQNNEFGSTEPTSTDFGVGTNDNINASGRTYVAYLFAHNAGGFGLNSTDNVISCGSYTTDGSGNATVNLGYEPQWLMTKASSTTSDWQMFDNMRGFVATGDSNPLAANSSRAEDVGTYGTGINLTSTGFNSNATSASQTFIYIAIRRGPMKVPTDATKVFEPATRTGTGANATVTTAITPVDMAWAFNRTGYLGQSTIDFDRLRGALRAIYTGDTAAEFSAPNTLTGFDVQNGYRLGSDSSGYGINYSGATFVNYNFRRAPSFFDEVCYTGTGVRPLQLSHNLGAVPELMIVKIRATAAQPWFVYSSSLGNTKYLNLNTTAASATSISAWSNTTPTSTTFTVGDFDAVNGSTNYTYVAYLFATCAGVSKVGSYSGTGATQTVDCGFSGGARWVMVKRTDSTGDWYVWDTARGMVSGTDPSLLLNSSAAEVNANSVYTATTGFQIVSTAAGINASGGTYIFLAIA